jgi:hypothetical protein
MEQTPEQIEAKKAQRKQKQHEAWKRWYASDKGKAYYKKRLVRETTQEAK